MKSVTVLALSLVSIAPLLHPQAPADPYAYILAGAPVAQRDGAGVLKWKAARTAPG